mmetsp:Transcript_16156/g.25793  ORF Transcript_16156/g.25793 Transcript_16156/m.25793 type:complete len:364 (-) Transcript_16156:1266-2357(-)
MMHNALEQSPRSLPSAAPPQSVWAAKAALRETERAVERKKEEDKKVLATPAFTPVDSDGTRKDQNLEKPRRESRPVNPGPGQNPGHAGAEGQLVCSDGQNASMWLRVEREYAGFIVGPLGRVIAEIAQQTSAHILSPRKGEDSIFVISGASSSVKAAAALIRVKEQEGRERERRGPAQEVTCIVCAVPESLVGFVMGSQRSVIIYIQHQTRTEITCPIRGGKPEFIIAGAPICVEAAKACIEAKVLQAAMGTWQSSHETITIHVTIGVDKVGLVVGPMGSVVQHIMLQTGTAIISPRKGQDPVFVLTGAKRNVEMAKQMIESKATLNGTRLPGTKPGRKGRIVKVDAMNRPLIVDGLARGAPP